MNPIPFAVNYSPVLAELVRAGRVRIDRFKCPAWPALLAEARQTLPVYVHFPLVIGGDWGGAWDDEKKQLANLDEVSALLEGTDTPLVNTHFIPSVREYADIPSDSRAPRHVQRVLSAAMRDLEPLIHRFGAQRVTIEHVINEHGYLTLAVLPEVIGRLVEESGCGFLLDLSHARLAARNLGLDARAYVRELPLEHIREIHITGLQNMSGELYARLMAAGDPDGFASKLRGKWMDHLPMQAEDWPELAWMMTEIRKGAPWHEPWIIASEVGGVGGFWELLADADMYLEQVPRMAALIAGCAAPDLKE